MEDIIVILILILVNGLFSMSEVALISARKSKLSADAKRGNGAAKAALKLAGDPDRFLSTIQIGITLIGILTGLYSGATLAGAFSEVLTRWGIAPSHAHAVAQTSIVVVVTYLSIVVGELVPKRIGLGVADTVAKIVARPMRLLSLIAMPAVWLLSVSTTGIVKLLRLRDDGNRVTEDEIKSLIRDGADAGEVKEVEQDIMERALVMGSQRVSSIMTCRIEVAALDISMTADDVRRCLADELHECYPVFDDEHEQVCGIVSLKDLIFTLENPEFKLADVMRRGTFIPESMTAYDALEVLKGRDAHCVMVCDEFGSLQGVLTLRDILDGLVGLIDESRVQPYISAMPDDDGFIVDGQCPVYDFLTYFDSEDLYQPATYATLGGLILEMVKKIPEVGDVMRWHNFEFKIEKMDGARIDKIEVRRLSRNNEDDE